MDINVIMQQISVMILPILLAVTLHEAGHAYTAYKLGDDTAARQGRLSFNPLVHVDPFGTVFLPGMMLLLGTGFVFGYAKPVPVNFGRLKKPRRDTILVALAGPSANIILAIAGAIVLRVALGMGYGQMDWIVQTAQFMVFFNCLLFIFNMMPIPPLDGGRILMELVSYNTRQKIQQLERFGIFIVLAIVIFIPAVIQVPLRFLAGLVFTLVGL